jgi:polar amino acid transport system substrate-binding protein
VRITFLFWLVTCQILANLLSGQPVHAQSSLVFSKPGPLDYTAQISEEILKEAYARIGIAVTTQEFPGERALRMSNSGAVDGEVNRIRGIAKIYPNLRIVPVAINLIDGMAFTKNPEIKIKTWDSLSPYIIGLRTGAKFAEFGTQGMNVISVTTNDQVFRMLDKRRVDVAISTRIEGVLTVKNLKLRNIRLLEPPLLTIELFHFLNKKHEALTPRITKALEEMGREGRIRSIKEIAMKRHLE